METSTAIIIAVLIIALLFLAITVLSSNNSSGVSRVSSSYPSGQYIGGGCGR